LLRQAWGTQTRETAQTGVPAFLVPGHPEQRVFPLPVLRREFSNPFSVLRAPDWLGSASFYERAGALQAEQKRVRHA